MEPKQFFRSIIPIILIVLLINLLSWYININKKNYKTTINFYKDVTNELKDDEKHKLNPEDEKLNDKYFIDKHSTYECEKSLIPFIYKEKKLKSTKYYYNYTSY